MGFPGGSLQGKRAWSGPIGILPDLPSLPPTPVGGNLGARPLILKFALTSHN